MGLSSSQARMLTLKAEKSDLELRATSISQRKLDLARATQEAATEYSNAVSNRKLSLIVEKDGNSNNYESVNLTYSQLTADQGVAGGSILVTDVYGRYVLSSGSEKEVNALFKKLEGHLPEGMKAVEYVVVPDVKNAKYFQSNLKNGGFRLQQLSEDKNKFENVGWSSLDFIQNDYDKSDDDVAQAKHDAKLAILSQQDKELDLELQQIETQRSAIKTEIDTVKSMIKDNIEKGFKYFE